MRAVLFALIVIGIGGLILSGLLPAIGLAGMIGSVVSLLCGIGFLLLGRCHGGCM